MKKAFVTCVHCLKPFLSPIQVPEGIVLEAGETTPCSHCRAITPVKDLSWHEIGLDGNTR